MANAGLGDGSLLADVTEEQFDFVFGVNAKSSLLTVQKSLPLLARPAAHECLAADTHVSHGQRTSWERAGASPDG